MDLGSSSSRVWGIGELTRYLKGLLSTDPVLREVWVRGEISNLRQPVSGHLYFTLKDKEAALKAVLFRRHVPAFVPNDGMAVLARGYVSLYERDGVYQLYVEEMEPAGLGAAHLALQQLKNRLEAEGLFDPARKRPLPFRPRRAGIVTSLTGAALRDIVSVARRRDPGVDLVVASVLVQGEDAPGSIAGAVGDLGALPGIEVIIVGRGGGSIEELMAFNAEGVVRAVAACPVPVVAAVGHQTDFTLTDYAADVRAATPSAAAEICFPDRRELAARVNNLHARLLGVQRRVLERGRMRLEYLAGRPLFAHPRRWFDEQQERVDDAGRKLAVAFRSRLGEGAKRLEILCGKLDSLSPLAVLGRGYSICRREAGDVVRDGASLTQGDAVEVALHRGGFRGRVEEAWGKE